jgi:CheY-like chemotaxis protein
LATDGEVQIPQLGAQADQPAPARAQRRILLIDDQEASRYVLRNLLGLGSGDILEATGGGSGLRRAVDDMPEVIFLDLNMPDMNGVDVLHALKADVRTKHIPVIIYTSKALSTAERRRLELSAAAIVSKELPSRAEAAAAVGAALSKAGWENERVAQS